VYRFLASNYDVGDEIFFVVFSRGAYTARAVTGTGRAVRAVDEEGDG
jgi:uncharacterized protein (DUF2235 family)